IGDWSVTGVQTCALPICVATYLSGRTDNARKFILLATDGLPTCSSAGAGGDDSTAAIAAVGAANTAGFPTFVVGIATGTGNANRSGKRRGGEGRTAGRRR